MVISFLMTVGGNSTQVYLQQKPNLHNTKPWYCFDEPLCQSVIYWSNSGPNANKWVYSLTGLNGTAVSTLDNNSNQYPFSYSYTWVNLDEENSINSSVSPYMNINFENCRTEESYACLDELALYFSISQFEELMNSGIVDESTINESSGSSQICSLKNILLDLNPLLTPTQVHEYYIELLDSGLIIDNTIEPCNTLITSRDTFLSAEEAGEIGYYSHSFITCNGEKIILYSNTPNLGPGVILYEDYQLSITASNAAYCTDSSYQTCYNVTTNDGVIQEIIFCI